MAARLGRHEVGVTDGWGVPRATDATARVGAERSVRERVARTAAHASANEG